MLMLPPLCWLLQDFHPSDKFRIASCGMDNTVKIWSMKGTKDDSSNAIRTNNKIHNENKKCTHPELC